MRTTNQFFAMITLMLLLSFNSVSAQEQSQAPLYYVVTTMHFNLDNDSDAKWIDVEKEYLDKVTMKNEYIMGAGFYTHLYTSNSTDVKYVQVYGSWDAIEKADKRNAELAKEAWPNEEARAAFFKTQGSFYDSKHSDEIYSVAPGTKVRTSELTDNSVLYVRTSHLAYPSDAVPGELSKARAEYVENVINKNELIKGYYPHRHFYGHNSSEFIEAFFVDSMADLEASNARSGELFRAHWKDDASRKAFTAIQRKYFTGVHGDEVYSVVAGLRK
ncbi:hypothetical protein ACS386_04190 [Flavobacteriaceae bacterium LMO-SS05]